MRSCVSPGCLNVHSGYRDILFTLYFIFYLYVYIQKGELVWFFFQAEDGIRDLVRSRGLGDVYKRQGMLCDSALVLLKLRELTLS